MAIDFTMNSPSFAISRGMGIGEQLKQSIIEKSQLQQKQSMQSEVAGLLDRGPISSEDISRLSVKYPQFNEQFNQIWNRQTEQQRQGQMRQASDVYAALETGSLDIAKNLLEENAVAAENGGDQRAAGAARAIAKMIDANPEAAKLAVGSRLSLMMGPEKFADTFKTLGAEQRERELQPGAIKKRAADLNLTKAQTNKELVSARKMEAEIAKTNAEAGKVAAEAASKAMELKYGKPVELTTEGEKLLNKSVADAANSASLANQYDNLAGQIEDEISTAGAPGRAAEVTKRFFGSENQVTRLRQEYQRLRNSAVLTMLPPGVASDKDIEIAMGAFPSDTSNPELIASFMRGMAKLQRYDSQLNNMKAEWVSEVGNLGKSKKTISVAGETVEPGTTFNEFAESKISVPDTISDQSETETGRPAQQPAQAQEQRTIVVDW